MIISPSTTAAVILAAGKGSRLKSTDTNKVTIPLGGKPMIRWSVDHIRQAGITEVVVVVGFAEESVRAVLGSEVTYVKQTEQLGTGHAAQVGATALKPEVERFFLLYGDHSAFYTPIFFQELYEKHLTEGNGITLVSLDHANPSELAWGRIIRNSDGAVTGIVEEKEATEEEKKITELNAGLYIIDTKVLAAGYSTFQPQSGGEYYITDLVAYCVSQNIRVGAVIATEDEVGIGVNTVEQKEAAQKLFTQLEDLN